jgi:flagellar biosynthesis GTPase FlhF
MSKPKQIHLPRGWWKKIESQQAEMDLQLVDIEDEMQHFERLEQRRLAERRRLARKEAAKAAERARRRERAAQERKEAAAAAAARKTARDAAKAAERLLRMQREQLLAAEKAKLQRAEDEKQVQQIIDNAGGLVDNPARSTAKQCFAEVFARACRGQRLPIVAFIRHIGGSDASRSYTTELGSIEGVTRHVWEVTLPKVSLAFRYTQEEYTREQNPRTAASICLYYRWDNSDWRPMDTPHEMLRVAMAGGIARRNRVYQAILGVAGREFVGLQEQMIEYLKAKHAQTAEPAENS